MYTFFINLTCSSENMMIIADSFRINSYDFIFDLNRQPIFYISRCLVKDIYYVETVTRERIYLVKDTVKVGDLDV